MKIVIFVVAFLGQVFASESLDQASVEEVFPIATIVQIEGKAKILPASSIKKHTATVGEGLLEGDKLIAYADTKVLISLLDNSKIILNEGAELLFSSDTHLKHERGEVYYQITQRTKSKGLNVETPFSIIGIKGTEFIVNFEGEGQIALNEGLVSVTSPGTDFELYQAKELSEFEKYQREQDAAFEAYKRETEDQIAAYVKSFELQANKMLTFSAASDCKESCESRVAEQDFTQEIIDQFETYQAMSGN